MSAFLYHTASRKLAEQTIGQIKKNHIIYIVQTAYELNECDYYEYPSDLKVVWQGAWQGGRAGE